ncbi:hypothetical protein B0H11DRAFT_1943644 [Mycena galericulata]|nr:hypothetical protein B0H11DRAFT_1943644 [Mycena galericulata]
MFPETQWHQSLVGSMNGGHPWAIHGHDSRSSILKPVIWMTSGTCATYPNVHTSCQLFKLHLSLLAQLHEVCRLGNLLETSHPNVEQSFRFHNWKMSYGRLICKWTCTSISEEEYEKRRCKPDPDYEFKPKEAMDLLCFMSSHHHMHPWVHNPMAVYLFLSVDCFEFNAETWLLPCLEALNYPRVEGWNSETVYRMIKCLPLLKDTSTPDSLAFLNALEDRKLAVVLEETTAHRALMHCVRQYTWPPSPETDDHSSSSCSGAASSSCGALLHVVLN